MFIFIIIIIIIFCLECTLNAEKRHHLSDSLNFIPIVTMDLFVNGNADFTDEINLITTHN